VTATWDPLQYNLYKDERSRPFFELLARIPTAAFGR
jgi:trans-aconitate methyltransferase